tara:strand:+ start:17768 stop:18895 length:1128 start_codon:yes stop_codon:yes gene_type:complete
MSDASLQQADNATTVNLLDYDRDALQQFFTDLDEPKYRATQVLQWIHQHGATNFDEMTNLSKASRAKLQTLATIKLPEIALDQASTDGTRKWLLRLDDGNCIETVYIPEDDRGTLCVSSQIGCALNCSFCSTGAMGFNRNLTVAEIIGQVRLAVQLLSADNKTHDKRVTNVVMMGMGEPLLNYDKVLPAMNIMMDDFGYGLSKYRVTLSTSGVVPTMHELAKDSECSLAVSLHAANDELRNELVPINKKYPLEKLMGACRAFFTTQARRKVTFEYTMLNGINDQTKHAKQLINLLAGMPCKINLIPFNPFPNTDYICSDRDVIVKFRDKLIAAGFNAIIRKTRGEDIDAACGQLAGDFTDRTSRSKRIIAMRKAA